MRLSHGFMVGVNNVTYTKCIKWCNGSINKEMDFIVVKARESGFEVVSFDTTWLKIIINNDDDVNKFYNLVLTCKENEDDKIINRVIAENAEAMDELSK
ncbi:hypothetical protein KPL47_15060 [Clostridium estertheticum]|uniref:hypothetical protein n=1 Tax=Clostridium estertheticum TaxID=238834 RepID=UPI001C0C9F77|nr:hypothetical protein [Clostridium estertheticum]MBU3177652.1 hypothetical protein [Clostridium estertheticum]